MDHVNFLPQRIRSQRAKRGRRVRQAYLLLLCAAALVGLGYVRQHRVEAARADVALLKGSAEDLRQQAARRDVLQRQLQDLSIRKQVQEHLGSRVSAQVVLAELHRQMPPSLCLTSLELETMEVPLARKALTNVSVRATVAGGAERRPETAKRLRLTLTGLAPNDVDVANFIGQLSSSPLFEDVNMGYSRSVTYKGRMAREFRASCYVVR